MKGSKIMSQLKGRRTIVVARCSVDDNADASIPKQIELGEMFCARNEMIKVDSVSLPGKSASLREHVPYLKELLLRRQTKRDYDALYFLTLSRFDRARAEGEELFRAFEKAGVLIVTEKEGTFTGKYGWLKRGIVLQEAQGYVEDLAMHTATGSMRAIKLGLIPHCTSYVYGIDRKYLDAAGVAQYIARRLSKRETVRLHPETGERLGIMVFETGGKGSSSRIAGGKITLVPGDPVKVAVVNRIFELRYVHGWGATRIARVLNNEGIPGPRVDEWCEPTIRQIYLNPLYTGTGITNRKTRAKYVTRGKDGPIVWETPRECQPRKDDPTIMCEILPTINRPSSEWVEVEFPDLTNFLSEQIRERAMKGQEQYLKSLDMKRELNLAGQASGGCRHHHDIFPLSGIIRELQTGNPMTGNRSGSGKVKGTSEVREGYRSYKCSRAKYRPKNDGRGVGIGAVPLEKAVLDAVTGVIGKDAELGGIVRQQVMDAFEAAQEGRNHFAELQNEKAELEDEYTIITRQLGRRGRELAMERANWIEHRLDALDEQIDLIGSTQLVTPEQVEETVVVVLDKLNGIGAMLESGEIKGRDLHRLYKTVIHRLDLDLVTKDVYLDIGLPRAILTGPIDSRLVDNSANSTIHETGVGEALILASFDCQYKKTSWKACLSCHRRTIHNKPVADDPSLAA
jgi:hypothetical protein